MQCSKINSKTVSKTVNLFTVQVVNQSQKLLVETPKSSPIGALNLVQKAKNSKTVNLFTIQIGIEAVSDNSQLSVKFPNGEILSAAKAGMTLELDYHGQLFRPLLTEASFESNTFTVKRIQDIMQKVGLLIQQPQDTLF